MSSVFQGYEEDFESYASQISRKVSELSSSTTTPQERKRVVREARRFLQEANQCLQSMEIEARPLAPNVRRAYTQKIEQHKNDLSNLRRDLERAVQQSERSTLMKGTSTEAELSQKSRDQRERAADAARTMNRGTQRLEETRRTLAETEDIGLNTLSDLHHQRETLLRAHQKVKETNVLTGRARRILTGIKARACTNKLMLWGIIIILLGLIGVVLYFGIKKI